MKIGTTIVVMHTIVHGLHGRNQCRRRPGFGLSRIGWPITIRPKVRIEPLEHQFGFSENTTNVNVIY
jgi:hypothetical protein